MSGLPNTKSATFAIGQALLVTSEPGTPAPVATCCHTTTSEKTGIVTATCCRCKAVGELLPPHLRGTKDERGRVRGSFVEKDGHTFCGDFCRDKGGATS